MDDPRILKLDLDDNVFVAIQPIEAGSELRIEDRLLAVPQTIPLGYKIAARDLKTGEKIIKYHAAIGSATCDIAAGETVHLHNMKSDYLPTYTRDEGRRYGRH